VDIHFFDGDSAPKPRDQVRIEQLEIHPYPDRFRVYIHVRVTPFLERPNLLLSLHDEQDQVVSELSIIETMHHDMEFTLHIRNRPDPAGVYTLTADLFYETRHPPQDRMVEGFVIPNEDEEPS
jgi:hypothetical protein